MNGRLRLRPSFAMLLACGGLRPLGAPRRRPAAPPWGGGLRRRLHRDPHKAFTRYCCTLA